MFDRIAPRYDMLNRLNSMGLDRIWRRKLVSALFDPAPTVVGTVLDLATGTADVAVAAARAYPQLSVLGVDPSAEMLRFAAAKVVAAGLDSRVKLMLGDAQRLPLRDDCIAASCISFGIRNVRDRLAALREMRRVTRPGGVVAVLELAEPRGGVLAPLARWYVRHVVPTLGRWLSRGQEYRYLQQSMAAFPAPAEFRELMAQAGLAQPNSTDLAWGTVHLFCGRA